MLGPLFLPLKKQFTCNCTSVPLLFHIVPAKVETFILWWDEVSYSLLTGVPFTARHQAWYRKYFHLAIIFKFVTAKILRKR